MRFWNVLTKNHLTIELSAWKEPMSRLNLFTTSFISYLRWLFLFLEKAVSIPQMQYEETQIERIGSLCLLLLRCTEMSFYDASK